MQPIPRINVALGLHPDLEPKGRPEVPTYETLQAPLVLHLAERSLYQIRRPVLIPSGRQRNPVLDAVLNLAGYNPDEPDSLPLPLWTPTSQGRDRSLYRRCWYAWNRSSQEGWSDASLRNNRVDLFTKFGHRGGRGNRLRVVPVGLTERGISQAIQVRPHFVENPEKNVTNLWLQGQLQEYDLMADVMEQLRTLWVLGLLDRKPYEGTRHPRDARKDPVFQEQWDLLTDLFAPYCGSRRTPLYKALYRQLQQAPQLARETEDDIHEHLNGYFDVAIARDSFSKRLTMGEEPTRRQLGGWAIRKAISTFRHRAQDAVDRQYRGARTKIERDAVQLYEESLTNPDLDTEACRKQMEKVTRAAMNPTPYTQVMQDTRDEITGDVASSLVVVDPQGEQAILHEVAWRIGMQRVKKVIREKKAGNPDRYEQVLDDICEGIPVAEQAEKEGCSVNRMAAIRAEARNAIKAGRQTSEDAHRLIAYTVAEPFSTAEEITAEFPGIDNVPALLTRLVVRGRLDLDENGGYQPTPAGHVFFLLRHRLSVEARRVLRLVGEDTRATMESLGAEFPDLDVEDLLISLLDHRCVCDHRGNYRTDGPLVITPAGEAILSSAGFQADADDFETFLSL